MPAICHLYRLDRQYTTTLRRRDSSPTWLGQNVPKAGLRATSLAMRAATRTNMPIFGAPDISTLLR